MKKFLFTLALCLSLISVNSVLILGETPLVSSYEQWHQIMLNAMNNLEPSIKLSLKNFDKKVYNIENSDFSSVNIFAEGTISGNTATIVYTFNYPENFKLLRMSENEKLLPKLTPDEIRIFNKVKEITNALNKDAESDYQKILNIHDYIVQNNKYDTEIVVSNNVRGKSFEVSGLVDNSVGVCESYAAMFQLMSTFSGIESRIVVGSSKNVAHAWNMINLDGEYYHIDTTWDDPTPDRGAGIIYKYFNLTDTEISNDHVWDKTKTPAANGVKYNYYVYNNMVVNNMNELQNYLKTKLAAKPVEIHFYAKGFTIKDTADLSFTFGISGVRGYSLVGDLNGDGAFVYIPTYK